MKYFNITSRSKNRGSALMIALFVIIVMSLLGTALVNMQSTSSESIAQEVLGTRALAAARSGAQRQLTLLFPLAPAVGTGCPASAYTGNFLDGDPPIGNQVNGLQNCSVSVLCENYAANGATQYYRLTSTGTCGSGNIGTSSTNVVSSRTIQIEARDIQ